MTQLHAVITAGGTSEPIDDVRMVTNLSRGRFGAALAEALVTRGVRVTLLASASLADHPEWIDPAATVVPFRSFRDLDLALGRVLADDPADLLFMAAAVADYAPVPASGKIRSTEDELVVHMRRNPKLLAGLRRRCGPETFLVGFKLLSGVSSDELVRTALRQVRSDELDLTVANDLQYLRGDTHPVVLVTPEGGARDIAGTKRTTAGQIADFALRRRGVRWARPRGAPSSTGPLGAFARQVGLHSATHRHGAAAGADALLYRALPRLEAILHGHGPLVLAKTTVADLPCGCLDQADALASALADAARRGWKGPDFALRAPHHGWWIGLSAPAAASLPSAWQALRERWLEARGGPAPGQPIFRGCELVGAATSVERAGRTWLEPWVHPDERGRGTGGLLAHALGTAAFGIVLPAGSAARRFFTDRGFRADEAETRTWLMPPSARTDLVRAASACLVDVRTGRVLLGRRPSGAWAFPGGRVEAGEGALAAALRELTEETGVVAELPVVRAEHTVHVARGGRAFAVRCFVLDVLEASEPEPTEELEARWLSPGQARSLRPLAPGVRVVLDALGPTHST